jgi:DNA-directed RNA polymerase subunit M/transcription elongation factor TFIIS
MPVKVRCPSCDKLLNAPDAARGKAIKCPGCETKVRVPAEGTPKVAAKAEKKKDSASDSREFQAIDLSKAEESGSSLCPKCGTEIPDDAKECPKCGIDPATGQLSAAAQKRASRKGPDPALFYKTVWKDSFEFTKKNKSVVFRTAIYGVLSYSLAGFCGFMVGWCSGMPPKTFWAGIGFLAMQIFPGWLWFLTTETVKVTLPKKDNIRDLNFDLFQNVALGIKTIIWSIVFLSPITFVMYPLAMIHMSMPVTTPGWLFPKMIPIFLRNLAPTLYWWLIVLATNSLVIIGMGVMGVVYGATLLAYLQPQDPDFPIVFDWKLLIIPIVTVLFSTIAVSFTSIFQMRALGLLAYYFRERLDLITLVAEQVYVAKVIKVDKFGVPIKTKGQKVTQIVVPIVALILVMIAGYYVWYSLSKD